MNERRAHAGSRAEPGHHLDAAAGRREAVRPRRGATQVLINRRIQSSSTAGKRSGRLSKA
jgi:hypothetical protein